MTMTDLVCSTGRTSDVLAGAYAPCDEPPRWRFRPTGEGEDAWLHCCTLHKSWLAETRHDIERLAVTW